MTNALLNNLNISIEKTVKMTDKMSKTGVLDFDKIFEAKTKKLTQNSNQTTKVQNNNTQNSETHKTDNNTDDKITTVNNNEESTNQTTNSNKENETDTKGKPYNNSEKDFQEANDDKQAQITENITTNKDEAETETDTNIINTITEEEEPTMYNELNTLEDPTTMLILQTQIQKNIRNCLENEQLDDFSENKTDFGSNENSLTTNTAIFKQIDNSTTSKDINVNQFVKNIPLKNTTQTKDSGSKISNVIKENIVKELNVEVLSSQSSETGASFGDLMQNQSPQEQAARVMIQNDVKFETIKAETLKNVQVKPETISPSKIIEQITKQLDGMVNNSKLNLVLNPGSLGKVNLQLMNTKDGLTAQFTVTTQDVKDILMKGLDGLKENLLAQGVTVDNVSIKLDETEREYNPNYTEQESSKGGNKQQGFKQQKNNEQSFEDILETNNKTNIGIEDSEV